MSTTQGMRVTPESFRGVDVDNTRVATATSLKETMEGSNNQVIAPGKSTADRVAIANDPHRVYSAPGLHCIAHISTPTLDITGTGEPSLPAVSIGYNGHVAFGLTIFNIDQEDLYVYELDPANNTGYCYNGGWEPLSALHETVRMRGGGPRPIDLTFTRYGLVIYIDTEKHRAYAVRSMWLSPGMSPYFGSVGYVRIRTFMQFKQSTMNWGAPTGDQVYTGTKGNIGWVLDGLAPARPNWDGLLLVSGDGHYEWVGFWRDGQLSSSYNPRSGYFTLSDEMNLPPDYPYRERRLDFEWANSSRHVHIDEVLIRLDKASIEDSVHPQNNMVSIPAYGLMALLAHLSSNDAST